MRIFILISCMFMGLTAQTESEKQEYAKNYLKYNSEVVVKEISRDLIKFSISEEDTTILLNRLNRIDKNLLSYSFKWKENIGVIRFEFKEMDIKGFYYKLGFHFVESNKGKQDYRSYIKKLNI